MARKIRMTVHRLSLILTLVMTSIGCDQATKVVARDTLNMSGPLQYLSGSVRLEHAQNPGVFLSLGAELPPSFKFWLFNVAVAVGLLAIAYFLIAKKQVSPFMTVGLSLVLGGGAGNLIDRFLYGSVTDFLILSLGPLHTGIVNIADMVIVFGIALMALGMSDLRSVKSLASEVD